MRDKFVAGTRGSALALWQTRYVMKLLLAAWPDRIREIDEKVISTIGDRRLEQALHTFGGKGAFTEELETKLRAGIIDFAVHSLKDIPTQMATDLTLAAVPKRAAANDAFISATGISFKELPQGARIGTSSLRRTAQLLHLRPDIEPVAIRGNVQTRLKKLNEGLDAVILARAGLDRLELEAAITHDLDADEWLPAAGQGALAIQCRADDKELQELLMAIHDEKTAWEVGAERAFLAAMEGGCQVPIGARAVVEDGHLRLDGMLASLDGRKMVRMQITGDAKEYMELGKKLAEEVLDNGGQKIWEDVRATLEVQ